MKNIQKLTVLTALALPAFAMAADNAKPEAPKAVVTAIAQGQSQDRSYMNDFAGVKPVLTTYDETTQKESKMRYVKSEIIKGIVHYAMAPEGAAEGGEMLIPANRTGIKFTYKPEGDLAIKIKDAIFSGNNEAAIGMMRKGIYPLIQLVAAPESLMAIQNDVINFTDLLMAAGRVNEAYAIMMSLDYAKIKPQFSAQAVKLIGELTKLGRYNDALKLADKLSFEGEFAVLIPDFLDALDTIRNAGKIKEVSRWYAKLQSLKENPDKLACTLWMLYCDISSGNLVSAKVFVKSTTIKNIDRKSPVFSLAQMIKGMLLTTSKQYKEALENFSEGIIYGKPTDQWMEELTYNTALCYKQINKPQVAKEIFEELGLFYPNSVFNKQAKAQIALIEKEAKAAQAQEE